MFCHVLAMYAFLAPKDIDLHLIQPGTLEQPPQPRHQLTGIVPAVKVDIHKHLFKMTEKTLNIADRRGRHIPTFIAGRHHRLEIWAAVATFKAFQIMHTQFIAHYLNRHGQIQGTVIGI